MHQVLLPWPEDLELALRRAELEVLTDAPGPTSKHYIGRWLPRLFAETGLTSVRLSTRAADRHAPLSEAERLYLASYLEGLVERLAGHLPADARAELAAHCTPGSPRYLPDQPDLAFTCIDQVVTGVRPGGG
jgi:hypothetical protein